MKVKLEKLRTRSDRAMDEVFKEQYVKEDLSRIRDVLTDVANIYFDLSRAASMKCRLNAIFDKRGLYKSVETAIHDRKAHDIHAYQLYDKLQESMDERNAIDKNINALYENFRLNPVAQRRSRFRSPPKVKFGKISEEVNKGLALAIDSVMNRPRSEPLPWKFKRISHRCFRNSKMLLEVQYCPNNKLRHEKEFVSCMKALLILNFGVLEDLIIGGEEETLWDPETIHTSKRKVYQEFTKSAKEIVLCSPVTKFTSRLPNNIIQCNNYIQSYVNCLINKCYYCKKHLRQFMPPTMVVREASPIICHKLCLMSQAP